jgi:hypothetical protein
VELRVPERLFRFHLLGIDPEMTVTDRIGRPIPVANGGEAIGDILA